ncbi:DNA helicase RecQ [Bacillus salitolerans]|uniref:DNA helicase RecQ n=1 Tax=Bacillus salitolerans TaxID=1437434 RepID=A0ABW4LJW2_9BACI
MLLEATSVLKKYYGYDSFRKGQAEAIESVIAGENSLVLMPTGGGKSICYQIPGLLAEGTTLVISPLISLMKDQVDSLNSMGIKATFINSSLTQEEVKNRIHAAHNGEFKLIYIAPERFESPQFRSLLQSLNVSIIAVDEAHCISQWGHDFRPSYRTLRLAINELSTKPVIVALTATATNEVIQDICKLLSISDEHIFSTGFKRKNLLFSIEKGVDRTSFITNYVKQHKDKSGIIYASTRKDVESLSNHLQKSGIKVGKYHAGLSDQDRENAQNMFLYDDVHVLVATNAFGMGINKSNVRYVIHYQLPKNIESYYQEAGRAGRDGEESECILCFAPQDIQLQKFLIEQTQLQPDMKKKEYQKLQSMVDYCHTEKCLQDYFIHYFIQDVSDQTCGNCSNCMDEREKVDITKDAQIIFSCIKRMNERFGVTLVAQVLKGSGNKRIKEFGFQQLTTYGLLKNYPEKEITFRIQFLLAEGFLKLSEGQYPTVSLTKRCVPVLRNEEKIFQRSLRQPESVSQINDGLFELLRKVRKEISSIENIPPFVVFSDSTLREMSEICPQNLDDMLEIKGVGEQKLAKYGQRFLDIIVDQIEKHGHQPTKEVVTSVKNMKNEHPSFLETYERYKSGQSLHEIAKGRELKIITIQNHIIQAIEAGKQIDWETEFSIEEEKLILETYDKVGSEKLKPLKDLLPDDIDYFKIKLVLAKQKLGTMTKTLA